MKHYLQSDLEIRSSMEQFSFSLITAIIAVMIGVFSTYDSKGEKVL